MRAFAVVVVAVATLLGIGWYFANSHMGAQAQKTAAANTGSSLPAVGASSTNTDFVLNANPHSNPNVNTSVGRPSDQLGLQKQNVSFETQRPSNMHNNHALKRGESDFAMPADENEVVGKYVHRQMVQPKGPSAAKHVPMNDDLLVLEGRSEDRLSATR